MRTLTNRDLHPLFARTVGLRPTWSRLVLLILAATGCVDDTSSGDAGLATETTASTTETTDDATETTDDTTESTDDTTTADTTDDATTTAGLECGNALVEADEECDDGNQIDTDTCTTECVAAVCGDGITQVGVEGCDDGNIDDFDMCTSLCTLSPESPTLQLSFSQIKQFEFSWEPVLGASYYQLLESTDVGEPFVQIGGDLMGESVALTMPLHFRINASYKLLACNDDGCSESEMVDVVGTLAEAVGYVKASNTGANDNFGYDVALSGDGSTLAIGAPLEDSNATGIDGDPANNSVSGSGAVYVFVLDGRVWSQQAYVKASNTDGGDRFGSSVALSMDGSTLAVGACWESSNATGVDGDQTDDSETEAGAVYVFERNGGAWSQQAYVKASNTQAADNFGIDVALSSDGNTLAVGAWKEGSNATGIDGNQADESAPGSGAAYVFARSGGIWSQQAYVKASNTEVSDFFGYSVALSGDADTLAVGAFAEDSGATGIDGNQADNSSSYAGAVYVFARNGGVWVQQAYVKASNTDASDSFGECVSLSGDGNIMAVGSAFEDSQATGVDGDQTDDSAFLSGAVYVFARNGGVWVQEAYVKASNTGAGDRFGVGVTLSSDASTLAVGARGEGSNATGIDGNQADDSSSYTGAGYVFARNGGVWSQKAYVKSSNAGTDDLVGVGVALSSDGDTLTLSGYLEGSSATGIGGDQADNSASAAGAVYLY